MKATTVEIVGVGGQGALFVAGIIGNAAIEDGLHVLMSEIHGMAQRGGVVSTVIRIGEEVHSPLSFSDDVDVLLGFEPVEVYRARGRLSKKTVVIMSTDRVVPFTVTAGLQEYPSVEEVVEEIKSRIPNVITLSSRELALKAGNALTQNVVMLGALSACGLLPIKRETLIETLKKRVKRNYVDVNLRAFELGEEMMRCCEIKR
ncbi:MAG: indolepyruvate oxidoreductase subunit beta [Thermoplasmata archaeon]|nr:indolepyruvate oxidoreductase subunit beta [Thermoplasmata archaeon]OYT50341.1 MAG: 2-oxoacid:ferredoxin oxidoreductase subunit gamma [Thermoplasmatales archaeon ex4484_36]HDD60252.1 2-oxoacid:ferredoxin oxidoreductase subunit gamma [Euryarchaeota archaeon]RLF56105.1 MAG: 2-oxoacid:ferredoxin oxidoreductase subunit gamma [Thermoplasmata archaeon]RLF72182.1 MAG: 2-oxoacid:ferredoxin oxidoreductase subunit gamma [Thermoplasmata archaeon]